MHAHLGITGEKLIWCTYIRVLFSTSFEIFKNYLEADESKRVEIFTESMRLSKKVKECHPASTRQKIQKISYAPPSVIFNIFITVAEIISLFWM